MINTKRSNKTKQRGFKVPTGTAPLTNIARMSRRMIMRGSRATAPKPIMHDRLGIYDAKTQTRRLGPDSKINDALSQLGA